MATTFKMHDAKTHLSSLIARAVAGEEIIIARGEQPQVKITPIVEAAKPNRVAGALKGKISIPDSFFDPMTEEELALWEGR